MSPLNGGILANDKPHPFLDLVAKGLPLAEALLSHGTPGMQLAAMLLAMIEKVKPPAPVPTA